MLLDDAAFFDSRRFAAEDDRDGQLENFVRADACEVDVQDGVFGVPLNFLDEDSFRELPES